MAEESKKTDPTEELKGAWMKFVKNAGDGIASALVSAMETQRQTYQSLGMEKDFEKMKQDVEGYASKMKEDVVSSLFSSYDNMKVITKSEEQAEAYKKLWEDAAKMVPGSVDIRRVQEMQTQWLENYNTVLKEFLRSDAFGKAMSVNLNAMLDARRKFMETNDEIAATLGLPTRAEMDELTRKVTDLWRQVCVLERLAKDSSKDKKRKK